MDYPTKPIIFIASYSVMMKKDLVGKSSMQQL